MSNRIVEENARTDGITDRSYWDADSSDQIEGFTTEFSVNAGQRVNFKVNVNGTASSDLPYKVEIFRLGYYGGAGAREVAEFRNADGTVQAAPLFDESRGLVDAGNWATTDHWDVPANAVSGVYIARVQRLDANGNTVDGATNQIPFIVRNDGVAADIVLQTSDTTWQAYNGWAGNNGKIGPNFYGDPAGMVSHGPVPDPGLGAQNRAYAVSYNRPLLTRDGGGAASGAQDSLYGADYAAISWLEHNGYDTSYVSGQDTDRLGADYLKNYKAFISVGHDEYWSGDQRAHVEAARDAGVNVLFWSGNEVYWKTRWETAISEDGAAYRTLVCYKETWANGDPNAGPEDYANIDPSNIWTGTWRDVRFLDAKDANGNYIAGGADPDPISGLRPTCHCGETTLTGQLFVGDGTGQFGGAIDVPTNYGSLRVWRNSAATNGEQDISPGIIGYEWDMAPDDANRPAGLIKLSETTLDWGAILTDQGNKTVPGTGTHNLTLYRAESGALVFASGTVFWSWGLSNEHDSSPYGAAAESPIIKQFSVNLFADMGIQPGSLAAGLIAATASLDKTPATATIHDLPATLAARSAVTITGTASDDDGNADTPDGAVALVELSFDNGTTWKPATGTTNWSYSWRPLAQGNYTVLARAVDDSLNVWNATPIAEQVTVGAAVPPSTFSLFDAMPPEGLSAASDSQPLETGMRFHVDQAGVVTQFRYFRDASDSTDTDVRDGHLWRVSDGALIGTATFNSAPGQSGWQFATLSSPIALQAGADYIVSYQSADNYVATNNFFAPSRDETFDGVNDNAFSDPYGIISAPQDAVGAPNGVFRYGTALQIPAETYSASNYWVDVTFDPNDGTENSPPVITSGDFTVAENKLAAGAVVASDPDGNPLTYAIAGGADADLFTINGASGVLSFKTGPDFELPQDQGANNVYDVLVSATDGQSTPVTRATTVTVADVDETAPTASTLFDGAPASFVSGSSDPTNYELGTKFFSAQDGTITALRYYRGTVDAGDTDVRTLRLWDAGNNLLGSITVTSTSGQSGWQVGALTTPIAITAGQNYIVSYGYLADNSDGAVESYAATGGYFNGAHTGPDGVLTAPASGGNGLYAVGPGNVPSQSYNSSNYWVDVLFQGGTAPTNQPPVFTSPEMFTAAENQTAVGLVTATDPNGNALTYSITGGADAALFTIGATTGQLEFKNPQDFEAGQQSFSVSLGVSDGIAPPTTQALIVNLSDVDETADGPSALTDNILKAEYIFGATPDTLFPGAGASQMATVGDSVEFAELPTAGSAVGNGNAGLASVDARTQTVRVEFPLDTGSETGAGFVRFSGASSGAPYNGVKLSDAGSLPAIRSVRIIGQEGFTSSNGAPQALTDGDLTVTSDGIFLNMADKGRLVDIDPDTPGAQAAWVEFLVELNDAPTLAAPLPDQLIATDVDGDTLTWSGSAQGTFGRFSIDASTGKWAYTLDNFDPDTQALKAGEVKTETFTAVVSDGHGGTDTQDVTVTVTGANDAPVGKATAVLAGGAEDTGYVVSAASLLQGFSDVDGDTLSVADLVTDHGTVTANNNGSFTVTLDADYNGPVTLSYQVVDGQGGAATALQTFTVAAVNDAPRDVSVIGATIAENAAKGTLVGTVSGVDVDAGDKLSYSLINNAGGRFAVDAASGKLTVLNGALLNYEAARSHDVTVRVTDLSGASFDEKVTIQLTNVVETQTKSLTSGADTFVASSDDNWIMNGLTGNDKITTLGGNDVVRGNAGDDTISTGAGDDIITYFEGKEGLDVVDGGLGVDRINALANNTIIGLKSIVGVEVVSANGYTGVSLLGSAGNDTLDFSDTTLANIAKIDGGAGNDLITGSADADQIVGNAGNDVLYGAGGVDRFLVGTGAGTDSYDGGDGYDTIVVTAAKVVIGLTELSHVEEISGNGFTSVTVATSATNDVLDLTGVTLTGITAINLGAGNDSFQGSDGNDYVIGGAGDDNLKGGIGNDTFEIGSGAGNDVIDGGLGSDTIKVTTTSFTWSNITGVEALTGTSLKLNATAGDDVLDFSSVSLTGVSKIYAGTGSDTVIGSAGADVIGFSEGRDTLTGGAGADIFDLDTVSESKVGQADLVVDFQQGSDTISLKDVDASTKKSGDQAFAFIGEAAFTGTAGQLRFVHLNDHSTTLYGDINADKVADFQIDLATYVAFKAVDFLL